MPAWDTKEQALEYIDAQYNYAEEYRGYAYNDFFDAYMHMAFSQTDDAVDDLIAGCWYLVMVLNYLTSKNTYYDPPYMIPYFLTHYAGGEITWRAICEAWAKDDFEGRAWTIALIDRMRQLLWDEPFNAVWAARPSDPGE